MVIQDKIWNGGTLEYLSHKDLFYRDDCAAHLVAAASGEHERMFESINDAANYGIRLRLAEIRKMQAEITKIKEWAKDNRE